MGSSPLARGAQAGIPRLETARGLIPARAGSTLGLTSRITRVWAHPRSRGEHACWTRPRAQAEGSSPLARGAPSAGTQRSANNGLIPARAGSTVFRRCFCRITGAHPRSRGEHRLTRCLSVKGAGSSPLARGALLGSFNSAVQRGLIPARAGSTPGKTPSTIPSRAHPRSRGEHF